MIRILLVTSIVLAGCAAQQSVTLMPRGGGSPIQGSFDHVYQKLSVDIDGQHYEGTPISKTSTTSANMFGGPSVSTSTNEQSALLIGPAGQVRCEFAWDQFKRMANGVCIDSRNVTYDMLIRNPS